MAVLAVLSSPNTPGAPDSAPRRVVAELPAVEVQVVQFVRTDDAAVPYFWASGVGTDELESVLRDDPRISGVERLERTDAGGFYRVDWDVDSPLIHCAASNGGVVMQARGTPAEWQLKVWFENGSDASAFHDCCLDRDVPLDVERLSSIEEVLAGDDDTGVTETQREAMVLAHREGYFEDPRDTSQEKLADQMGISSSALGRRLRRGFDNLVQETLIE